MKDLNTIQKYVEEVMTRYPETRDDDDLLYWRVCEAINPFINTMTFTQFLRNRGVAGVPSYGSVGRVGRKVRKMNEELRSSKQATEAKYKRWKEVREYAIKV